jgi:hypothetical protein
MGLERAYADGCSDNSSIVRTVESLLTNAVKRFVGRICDLAGKRAPRPAREGNQSLRRSKCLSPSLTGITMAQREPVMRQQSKARKKAKPLKASERSGLFPVVTSNLLNMICVTTVFATVLAVLLGVAKWT